MLLDVLHFSVADWQTFYNIGAANASGDFPWSEAILNSPCPFHTGKRVCETHFALAGLEKINLLVLESLNPPEAEPHFLPHAWDGWKKENFGAFKSLEPHWYLLLKDAVPGSASKTYEEQIAMLPPEYEAASAVAEAAKDFLIFKKAGVYVNSSCYARTSELDADGLRVYIGTCGTKGIDVSAYYEDDCRDYVGISASRRVPR